MSPEASAGATPFPPRLRRDAGALLGLLLVAWFGPVLAARVARPALLNFGPNDVDYVRGFRPDWEREGRTVYHWTSPHAEVTLPLGLCGDGVLRLRARRHFVEPAHVTLTAGGRVAAAFDLQRDPIVPYRTLEFPLSGLAGATPFTLTIEATSENPRPLGIALDWLEVERAPGARYVLPSGLRWAIVGATVLAFLAPRLAGLALPLAGTLGFFVAGSASAGLAWDVVAAERIVRLGLPVFAVTALAALLLVRWRRSAAFLELETAAPSGRVAGGLIALVLVALAVRLVLVLHPQFFYPDVRVHAQFAFELAKSGLAAFLRDFTANQYRHSLGLQLENGHWYAFPYPPAFYVLCWPLLRLLGCRPEVAVSVLAAAVNSLEALVVFGIARRLGGSSRTALTSAALLPLLPIFVARLTLAYFPALVGHAVDAVVILYLLTRLAQLDRPRVVVTLAGLVAAALLTYTQSLLNFGLLLPLFLLTQIAFDRTAGAWRRHAGLAVAGLLGALLSLVLFYGRYVPTFIDMQRGVPMPEEQVLVSHAHSAAAAAEAEADEEPDDPYAGPSVDLWRGVKKAGSRLRIFYGVFAPLVVVGIALVARRADASAARFVLVWAATYLLLNLASGGLPGPNLVRYNKDVEVVAPLCCVGLATLGTVLWERGRAWRFAAVALGVSFIGFGALRAVRYLTEKFVLER